MYSVRDFALGPSVQLVQILTSQTWQVFLSLLLLSMVTSLLLHLCTSGVLPWQYCPTSPWPAFGAVFFLSVLDLAEPRVHTQTRTRTYNLSLQRSWHCRCFLGYASLSSCLRGGDLCHGGPRQSLAWTGNRLGPASLSRLVVKPQTDANFSSLAALRLTAHTQGPKQKPSKHLEVSLTLHILTALPAGVPSI